jgi:uncharacterized protein (DUF433 family)
MEPVIGNYIETCADRCGGRPCIAGTRIRVQDIACDHEVHGLTPEQIAREYPQVTLAQVHAAWTGGRSRLKPRILARLGLCT